MLIKTTPEILMQDYKLITLVLVACKIKTTSEDVTHAGIIKISKSKNNRINLEAILEKYRADTFFITL